MPIIKSNLLNNRTEKLTDKSYYDSLMFETSKSQDTTLKSDTQAHQPEKVKLKIKTVENSNKLISNLTVNPSHATHWQTKAKSLNSTPSLSPKYDKLLLKKVDICSHRNLTSQKIKNFKSEKTAIIAKQSSLKKLPRKIESLVTDPNYDVLNLPKQHPNFQKQVPSVYATKFRHPINSYADQEFNKDLQNIRKHSISSKSTSTSIQSSTNFTTSLTNFFLHSDFASRPDFKSQSMNLPRSKSKDDILKNIDQQYQNLLKIRNEIG